MANNYCDENGRPAVKIEVLLSVDRAYALAELCKRIGWSDARSMSVDDDECRAMLSACEAVRAALDKADVRVR
jgi:hypothetical protein